MNTCLTSTVFAELLQMILPRFLSFDTFASFQTPGGQAVSCKNNRQSGKHQVKVFLSDLICIFILIFLPHSQESFPPETLLDNYIRQENVRQKSEEMIRELSTSTFQSESSYQYSHHGDPWNPLGKPCRWCSEWIFFILGCFLISSFWRLLGARLALES